MMRVKTILWIFLIALLNVNVFAQNVGIAPLEFKESSLPNGLKVIALEDRTSPTVTVQVWFRVGSKDDPEGRSGFAHLFEHMMFKSTKNMKSEMFDRLTEDVGGMNNASTWDDFTNYYEDVPSNYLETLLWAESERMVNLNVDEVNFKSERDVVKEEFRQRVLAQPYGRFFYSIEKNSFVVHPYRRPGIGSIEELDAASIEDVRSFYKTFYRPDNATLVVVGDFEPKQLDAWIKKYFGRIVQNKMMIPRVTATEPQRAQEKRFTEYAPNVPLPAVAVSYLVPSAQNADIPALRVAEAILGGGESSRLYQELVYKQQVAQEAAASADFRADNGLFTFYAIAAGGKKPEEVEKSLLSEIKKIQTAPPSSAEIEKAKNQLVTKALAERETNNGKGFVLGYAATIYGNPAEANNSIEKLQRVNAQDVQRAMQKYFADTNRVIIYYRNESEKENQNAK
jgi:zinc protease